MDLPSLRNFAASPGLTVFFRCKVSLSVLIRRIGIFSPIVKVNRRFLDGEIVAVIARERVRSFRGRKIR